METKRFTVEEIACALNVCAREIDLWYKWKRHNPDHPLAELLAEPVRIRRRRYWRPEDVENIRIFQQSIPRGRGGLFAQFTYRPKNKEDKE